MTRRVGAVSVVVAMYLVCMAAAAGAAPSRPESVRRAEGVASAAALGSTPGVDTQPVEVCFHDTGHDYRLPVTVGRSGPGFGLDGCAVRTGRLVLDGLSVPAGYGLIAVFVDAAGDEQGWLAYDTGGRLRLELPTGGCYSTGAADFSEPFEVVWSIGHGSTPTTIFAGPVGGAAETSCSIPQTVEDMYGWDLVLGWGSGSGLPGLGGDITVVALGGGGVEEEASIEVTEDCGLMPQGVCDGLDTIGGAIVGVVDAILDLGDLIVGALEQLAVWIWEAFKVLVFNPDTLGPAIEDLRDDLHDTGLGTWISGITALVTDLWPDVEEGTPEGFCLEPWDACPVDAVSDAPFAAQVAINVAAYAWAALVYSNLVAGTIRTVRRG